jgi:hypothetical protein
VRPRGTRNPATCALGLAAVEPEAGVSVRILPTLPTAEHKPEPRRRCAGRSRGPRAQAKERRERFIRTVRVECLHGLLIVSRRHLERVLRVFVGHTTPEAASRAQAPAPAPLASHRRPSPSPAPRPPRRPHPRVLPNRRLARNEYGALRPRRGWECHPLSSATRRWSPKPGRPTRRLLALRSAARPRRVAVAQLRPEPSPRSGLR